MRNLQYLINAYLCIVADIRGVIIDFTDSAQLKFIISKIDEIKKQIESFEKDEENFKKEIESLEGEKLKELVQQYIKDIPGWNFQKEKLNITKDDDLLLFIHKDKSELLKSKLIQHVQSQIRNTKRLDNDFSSAYFIFVTAITYLIVNNEFFGHNIAKNIVCVSSLILPIALVCFSMYYTHKVRSSPEDKNYNNMAIKTHKWLGRAGLCIFILSCGLALFNLTAKLTVSEDAIGECFLLTMISIIGVFCYFFLRENNALIEKLPLVNELVLKCNMSSNTENKDPTSSLAEPCCKSNNEEQKQNAAPGLNT